MDIDFESYIRGGEPDKKEKADAWKTAIGLQAVDGLQTSDYLKSTARKHIEGDISIDEVKIVDPKIPITREEYERIDNIITDGKMK